MTTDREPITDEDLARMEAYCAAATPGPWVWERRVSDISVFQPDAGGDLPLTVVFLEDTETAGYAVDEDMAFIAQARTDLPALVAEVRELRQALNDLMLNVPELHQPGYRQTSYVRRAARIAKG